MQKSSEIGNKANLMFLKKRKEKKRKKLKRKKKISYLVQEDIFRYPRRTIQPSFSLVKVEDRIEYDGVPVYLILSAALVIVLLQLIRSQ